MVPPLATLPPFLTVTGFYIEVNVNFCFANLQPGLQNFPGQGCSCSAGAVAGRSALKVVPPPRGRALPAPPGEPRPGPAMASLYRVRERPGVWVTGAEPAKPGATCSCLRVPYSAGAGNLGVRLGENRN